MSDCDLNKRALESLIKCGAFDDLGAHRAQLLAGYEKLMEGITCSRRRNLEGQMDLFGSAVGPGTGAAAPEAKLPDVPPLSSREQMRMEKETTGLYLSGHPMDDYRVPARQAGAAPIGEILADFSGEANLEDRRYFDEGRVTLAGIVAASRTKTTRNNALMAYVTLEDDTGTMERLCFSRVLEAGGHYLREGTPVLVTGRSRPRREGATASRGRRAATGGP
jgi:DNA polymerase-3 subunit alpha